MPGKSRGQMLVAAALLLGLLAMSLFVAAYHAHTTFLRARSLIARETVGAITADFNRALATMLSLSTRTYYDGNRFSDFTSRFEMFGLRPRDLDSARLVAYHYITKWVDVQRIAYAEQGVQITWRPFVCDVSHLLNRSAFVLDLVLIHWNETVAGSYICALMRLNLTNLGFYHWISYSLIGFTLWIYEVQYLPSENAIWIRFRALVNNGTFYALLLVKGWVEFYHIGRDGREQKLPIGDITYAGLGFYNVTLKLDGTSVSKGDRVLIVASDDRGILVLGQAEISIPEDRRDRGRGG